MENEKKQQIQNSTKVEEKMVPVSLLEKAWNGGYDSGYNREDSSVDKILFMEWFEQNVK